MSAFSLTWHIAYTTACCYRTSRDGYNFLLLARCQRCSWWRRRQWIICCWPTDVIVTMTSRHCTHTQTSRKLDMSGRVFLPCALAFTAIYVYTYILFVSPDKSILFFFINSNGLHTV